MLERDRDTESRSISTYRVLKKSILFSMQSIREGLLWVLPCLIISSLFLFIASAGEFALGKSADWIESCYAINRTITQAFPYLLTAAIGSVVAQKWKVPRAPVALLSIVFLLIAEAIITASGNDIFLTFSVFVAILTPLYGVPLLVKLRRVQRLELIRIDGAGRLVKESLNLVVPSFFIAIVVTAINMLLFQLLSAFTLSEESARQFFMDAPYIFGMVFAALNSFFWFLGIHGYYALLPMVDLLEEASQLNASFALVGGDPLYSMNMSFMGIFVFIGGSGATFSLIIALLMLSEHKTLRILALASIPIGLFNVNEIFLFGLPIIFNPRLFLPFLLTPLVNILVSLTLVNIGWVSMPAMTVPFNSPLLINAWVATEGNIYAVLLQMFNILFGAVIYAPSVMKLNELYTTEPIYIKTLDTTYTRQQEDVEMLNEDVVACIKERDRDWVQVEHHLQDIANQDFYLEYQPQVNVLTNKVVIAEALLRSMNSDGSKQLPMTFIPWLEKAGLMTDMDIWVIRQVSEDIRQAQRMGKNMQVSVNIAPGSLLDSAFFREIEQHISGIETSLCIEITEAALLTDPEKLNNVIRQLRDKGGRVFVDGFGMGHSSLSYLSQFDFDGLKIDKSFIVALDSDKGQKVFSSLFDIAEKMGLDVIVEGIETESQLSFIPKLGYISVQGEYYSGSLVLEDYWHYQYKMNG
ncbi:diguanylate phosphodiesterase [Vibrio albus]|uniref:Diguanylate phosphodiesterase n=1 Tax=Vibrio albus TaxID=2200953 RepID=A0A2U3BBA3_9VIBR|nr:EAL domain-containing protein [Vibrio albus]PWI34069.1 diguanylate phosphodiesterase [Vibrio albus]